MKRGLLRRDVLKAGALAGAGMTLGFWPGRPARAEAVKTSTPAAEKLGWTLAVQIYTFRRFPFYEAMEKTAELGITCVEPAFFLPLDKDRPELKVNETLAPEVRKELKARLAGRGMRMSNYYGDLKNDEADARKKFDFAKEMGVETFIAEPPPEAFDLIEKLCDEYKINLAVHNHPKSPQSRYWRPDNVLEVCKGRSKRIGACCDTGHWVRSGLNAVECLKKLEGRVLGFHLKDVIEAGNPAARDVPLGTGKADYAAVLKELHRQGYKGVLSIEYEHDSPELMQDLAQCAAFVEKMAKELAG